MNGFTRRRLLTFAATLPLALALPLYARAANAPEVVLQPAYSVTKYSLTEAFHKMEGLELQISMCGLE